MAIARLDSSAFEQHNLPRRPAADTLDAGEQLRFRCRPPIHKPQARLGRSHLGHAAWRPALPLWVAGLGIRPSYEQSPLMLWWFIGVWLASGAVLPVCWLLSRAYRAASKKIGQKGLYVLSGLVSIGALILLFMRPFGASNITIRDMPSASAVAQTPMMSAAEAKPIQLLTSDTLSLSLAQFAAKPAQTEPPSFGAAEQVATIQPQFVDVGESANDDASRQDAAAPLTAPVYPKIPSAGRGSVHRRTPGLPVRPYVTQLSHGTWLFPPNQTGGG